MTWKPTTVADAARLVAYAARPRLTPARDADYADLVRRYGEDDDLRAAAQAIATGQGLWLDVSTDVGVVAVAYPDSPMRMPLSEFSKRALPTYRRAINGIVLLGIAHIAYPEPGHVDDRFRVPRVSVDAVVSYLNRVTTALAADGGDRLAAADDLVELWRAWSDLRQARADQVRTSTSDRAGAVRYMCRFLADAGHLVEVSDSDGGTFRGTGRFRISVRALVEDASVYRDLLAAVSGGDAAAGSTTVTA